jgi:hypothetical protein
LVETLDVLTKAVNEKVPKDVIFLDFEKAFDKVSHRKLLMKLEWYGIKGEVLNWLKSFLMGRRQRVVLGNAQSEWANVKSGVPQGSVLGPLLFVLYINDMPKSVRFGLCKLFADDSKIIGTVRNMREQISLQCDLDNVVKWAMKWDMRLNYKKCKVMHVGKNNPRYDYSMCDEIGNRYVLEVTKCERDLGVYVSDNLTWDRHVESVSNKATSMLSWFAKAFETRDVAVWRRLYTTYIRPHVEYAVQAWRPFRQKDIETLERVQRKATKVPAVRRGMEYEERFEKIGKDGIRIGNRI